MTTYLCEHAWLGGAASEPDVLLGVEDGLLVSVEPASGGQIPAGTVRLPGLTVPGLANVHSHAFHRALRARTQTGSGTFWTWREQMYAVAQRLDPQSYLALATATYVEMAMAGITAVGEFHYLHHGPGGQRYDDPNAMAHALVEAAAVAGVRLTLLDTCYLTGGIGRPLDGVQARFGDGSAHAWAERADALATAYPSPARPDAAVRIGAAVHSVRAVPAADIPTVATWAHGRGAPLHAHLSEQVAENQACLEAYGCTPTQLLADSDALGRSCTVVHATHLSDADVAALGGTATGVCFCPTTERDLADGVGPVRALLDAGCSLSLGSDSHAVVDLFEEARAVETDERLVSMRRGHVDAATLLHAATAAGWEALGRPGGGRVAVGAPADLVTVRLDSVRTAGTGTGPEAAVFAATAADVVHVVVGGEVVVSEGVHVRVPEAGRALAEAVAAVLP